MTPDATLCTLYARSDADADRVTPDATLCTLYARSDADADRAEAAVRAAIRFSDTAVTPPPRCYAIITEKGVERP